MGCTDPSGRSPSRKLHLSLPPDDFDYGLEPTTAAVGVDLELEAVEILIEGAGVSLIMSQASVLDLILRLIGAMHRVQRHQRQMRGE